MTTRRAQHTRVVALTATWSTSLFCMVMGLCRFADSSAANQRAWFSWGLYLALVSVIVSGWAIVACYTRRERVRLEHLARIMAAEARRAERPAEGTLTLMR